MSVTTHRAKTKDDSYLDPYREAQSTHGSDFDVTLWANPRTQRKRFEVFERMVDLKGKRILDAGCSRGDLAAYLNERAIGYKRFVGIDGLKELIDYAASRKLPRSEFLTGDIVTQPRMLGTGNSEVIILSGTLNTMEDQQALDVLKNAWAACKQTLAFNFLSDRVSSDAPAEQSPARRLPTLHLIDWALTQTWNVRFRQDYFLNGHDATIVMSKR